MTPQELMRDRPTVLNLVIFDCDGVLVDSEAVSARVIATELSALGWEMTAVEAERRFVGTTLRAIAKRVEERLGRTLPADWAAQTAERVVAAMGREATAIEGAVEALRAATALGLAWRVASNSSHAEMRAKFGRLGILPLVEGRLHSFEDVPNGKPAPDVFLAAAAAASVDPAECVVVEDSVPGTIGAVAAGMDCLGYVPHGDGAALRSAGAVPFASMYELPSLFAAAPRPASR